MTLQVADVGDTSRKLYMFRDANSPVYGPGATGSNVNARRPHLPGTFASILELETGANPNYNSLQVTFSRRLS